MSFIELNIFFTKFHSKRVIERCMNMGEYFNSTICQNKITRESGQTTIEMDGRGLSIANQVVLVQ